jgi:hypothetical protein
VVARQILCRRQFIYIEAWKGYKGGPLGLAATRGIKGRKMY